MGPRDGGGGRRRAVAARTRSARQIDFFDIECGSAAVGGDFDLHFVLGGAKWRAGHGECWIDAAHFPGVRRHDRLDILWKLYEDACSDGVSQGCTDRGKGSFDVGQDLQGLFREVFGDELCLGVAARCVGNEDEIVDGHEA